MSRTDDGTRYGLGRAYERALRGRAQAEGTLAAALRRADDFEATERDVWLIIRELLSAGEIDLAVSAAAQVSDSRDEARWRLAMFGMTTTEVS